MSSGLTRSPNLCWAIKLSKTQTDEDRHYHTEHFKYANIPFKHYFSFYMTIFIHLTEVLSEAEIRKKLHI